MGIMILVQKAAALLLIASAMVSSLIMGAIFSWRSLLPQSKSGKAIFSIGSILFFVVFYSLVLGYKHNFWIFSFEIIDPLPAAKSR